MAHSTLRRGASASAASALIALALAAPASARQDKGTGTLHDDVASTSTGTVPTKVIQIHDGAVEYLQVGAGALGGMVLAGATAVALGRRHRTNPTPA